MFVHPVACFCCNKNLIRTRRTINTQFFHGSKKNLSMGSFATQSIWEWDFKSKLVVSEWKLSLEMQHFSVSLLCVCQLRSSVYSSICSVCPTVQTVWTVVQKRSPYFYAYTFAPYYSLSLWHCVFYLQYKSTICYILLSSLLHRIFVYLLFPLFSFHAFSYDGCWIAVSIIMKSMPFYFFFFWWWWCWALCNYIFVRGVIAFAVVVVLLVAAIGGAHVNDASYLVFW